ncbi:hypothetical protein SUGI_0250060 [Cryptomeria japonica]|nr:hypothetical protein SUGI_0250060 [Cryptomeria japonica]
MSDPKYSYPYPAQGYPQPGQQGYYQPQPPVMAPPQYTQAPPRKEPGFLEGWVSTARLPATGILSTAAAYDGAATVYTGSTSKVWLLFVAAACWTSAVVFFS